MNTYMHSKIKFLEALREKLENETIIAPIIAQAYVKNNWFIPEYIQKSIDAICQQFLNPDLLESFLSAYQNKESKQRIAIIAAGNIPLVGFHDLLCAYLCNAPTQIKLSSKDEPLMKFVIDQLNQIDPNASIRYVDRLEQFDKVIATGSENTHRYFEYYFKNYPSILRGNRTSVAVLQGNESKETLSLLMDDVMMYFGLGCRNVSKLFIPRDYPIQEIFLASEKYNHHFNHKKYMNNFEYNRTVYLLNNIAHLCNDFLILKEDEKLFSPIAVLYYERYDNQAMLLEKLAAVESSLQCIVSENKPGNVLPGNSQTPTLNQFADGVDTMKFILD